MLAKAGTSGDPIATPFVCLYIELLKLNSTENVALFINSTNTSFGMSGCKSNCRIQTDFDGFSKGNVGEQAGHIKKTHKDIKVDVKILHGLGKRKRI